MNYLVTIYNYDENKFQTTGVFLRDTDAIVEYLYTLNTQLISIIPQN